MFIIWGIVLLVDSLIFAYISYRYLPGPHGIMPLNYAIMGLVISMSSLLSWFVIGMIYACLSKVKKPGKRELLTGIIGETHGILGGIIAIVFFAAPDYLSIMATFPWFINYLGFAVFLKYVTGVAPSSLTACAVVYIATLIIMPMIFMSGVLIGGKIISNTKRKNMPIK
jgi:hypothetical protein